MLVTQDCKVAAAAVADVQFTLSSRGVGALRADASIQVYSSQLSL